MASPQDGWEATLDAHFQSVLTKDSIAVGRVRVCIVIVLEAHSGGAKRARCCLPRPLRCECWTNSRTVAILALTCASCVSHACLTLTLGSQCSPWDSWLLPNGAKMSTTRSRICPTSVSHRVQVVFLSVLLTSVSGFRAMKGGGCCPLYRPLARQTRRLAPRWTWMRNSAASA